MIGMTAMIYAQRAIKQPITGIRPEHLESVIRCLRSYHEDTGELPSAEGYLDLVRHAVENTVVRQEK